MKRVVCYCRVSTEEEKQLNALQKQVEELEQFVNNKIDWELIDTYVDEGKSGTSTKGRPSYQKLFDDLLTDKFDIVLIKDQSRLMRNVLDWYQFLDRLMKSEKQLYLYLDNCFYTPDNKFITGIKAMMAEEYSRDLSKKITSAARRSQKNGVVYGNSRTLGYKKNHGKLEIVPEEAELVRQIFEWYGQGIGMRQIKTNLKEMGITSSTGTDFSMSTLRRLLGNERYKGVLVANKMSYDFETKKQKHNPKEEYIIIPGGVPAIVSEELWNKCAEIRTARVEKFKCTKNAEHTQEEYYNRYRGLYPLSSKIICGRCGKPMCHDNSFEQSNYKGNQGRDLSKWICRTYRSYGNDISKGGCKNMRIYNVEIMDCLRKVIFDITNGQAQKSIKKIMKALKLSLDNKDNSKSISSLESQIKTIENKLSKLLDMFLEDTIDKPTYNSKKEELEDKTAQLQKQLTQLQSQNKNASSKESRIQEIENFLNTIYECPQNITDDIVAKITNHITIINNQDNTYMADVYLNINSDLNNDDKENNYVKVYTMSYPFIKQGCRYTMEDWTIDVYLS